VEVCPSQRERSSEPGSGRVHRALLAPKETPRETPQMTNRRVSRMFRTVMLRFAIGAIVVLVASVTGQVPAMPQTSDANSPPPASNTGSQAGNVQVVRKPSLFFPDLAHSAKPLTPGEKFRLAIANSVSPAAFLGSAFGAGIGQAADSPAGYGQGASAYGQRFGASMAKRASNNLIGTTSCLPCCTMILVIL
jgi:hypothetical protein